MADLVLFGAGDIARLAHYYFTHDSEHEVKAFAVDRQYLEGDEFLGLPLLPFDGLAERYPPGRVKMFVALSYAKMNQVRARKYRQVKEQGYSLESYVSSRCSWLSQHAPGDNCLILEDNTVQPFVRVGNNVTLWSGNHIGHDSVIEDHCFISSHVVVSGHVHVGQSCFIGVNATLRNSIRLAPRTLIGAGAVVLQDTEPDEVRVPPKSRRLERPSHAFDL